MPALPGACRYPRCEHVRLELHVRQLVEVRYTLAAVRAAPYGVACAGDW